MWVRKSNTQMREEAEKRTKAIDRLQKEMQKRYSGVPAEKILGEVMIDGCSVTGGQQT